MTNLLRRHGLTLGLFALCAVLSVKYTFKAIEGRSAILRWDDQLAEMGAGVDISQRYSYPNPPIMGVLLLPLTKLPPVATALVWYYLKVAMALLVLGWTFRLVEDPDRPFPTWAKVLAVLLSLRPIMGDLDHGNINLFILFLIVAGLTAFRRGWPALCGGLLGLAVACKVTPALFFPYFVWKRQWRVVAGGVVGLGLFLWPGVVPGLALGFEQNERQLASWYNDMVRPFVVEGKVWSEHNNQSLPGLTYRLATASPSFSTYVDNRYTPTEYHNVLALPPAAVKLFLKGCMGLFALLIVWSCRTPIPPRAGWRLSAEFALVMLGMLLFSERTWKHHCVTLVLPFAVLCYHAAAWSPSAWMAGTVYASLGATALLMATTSTGMLPERWAKLAQVYGAYVAAYLILIAMLLTLLKRSDSQAAVAATTGPVSAAA